MILAELANSNHSSTLGVATQGESIVFSSAVLAEVQIPRQSPPISRPVASKFQVVRPGSGCGLWGRGRVMGTYR